MLEGFFDSIYPEKDGALQASNMRFLMSVPKGTGKQLTGRRLAVLTAVAVIMLAVVFIGVTVLGAEEPTHRHPYMQILSESVGQTQETVLAALTQEEAGLAEMSQGRYAVTGGGEIAGLDFAVLLEFEETEGLLKAYEFATQRNLEPKEAAKFLEAFLKAYLGDTVTDATGNEIPVKKAALESILQEGFTLADSRNITPDPSYPSAVGDYIKHLESAEYWEGRMGEYVIQKAKFYRDIHIDYTENTLSVRLRYGIEADREH